MEVKQKNSKFLLIILCLSLLLFTQINITKSDSPLATGSGFHVRLYTYQSLSFQDGTLGKVKLYIYSGLFNTSTNSFNIYSSGGEYLFNLPDNCLIIVTYNVSRVSINKLGIESGANFTALAGTDYLIEWESEAPMILPFTFMIGMFGLALLFIGPAYGIKLMQKHDYRQGLVYGTILTCFGLAFFMAWLVA
jgi:hypothetical protein